MMHMNTISKTTNRLALISLLLCSTLYFSNIVRADDIGCNGAQATFSVNTGRVCLPVVEVPTASGMLYYQAQLQLVNGSNPVRFTLTNSVALPSTNLANAAFSGATGLLNIPALELKETFGTNRYSVSLQYTASGEFQLTPNIFAVIPPNYIPGETWKPYVGLLDNEKAALNVLGNSQAYTSLAVAIYDFGNKTVGQWVLKETTSTSNGMQAGVFVNSVTNEVALTFRGTDKLCFTPIVCSINAIKESERDFSADTLLTQGKDSGQFDDAYKFAQQILNTYAGRKITVTGHSLGGSLAQVVGAAYRLETYAFNSAPTPNDFFDAHGVKRQDPAYNQFIHVISDIHDPISNPSKLGVVYADAEYLSPMLAFDFDKKEITPNREITLDSLRANKHPMDVLRDNIAAVMQTYQSGW